jgi:hypothetical protein
MRILMLSSAFAVLSFGTVGMSAQSAAPPAPAVSRIHQLEIEDQSENPGNISAAEYYKHGDTRRAEIRKLLADGKITSGEDFSDAALIFQHGQTPDDFLFAHVLAVEGLIRGGAADKWIAAATLDRYLQAVNRPQLFGTQYPGDEAAGNAPKPQVDLKVMNIQRTQQPYDAKLLPDSVRTDFCVPDVSQQEKNLLIFNKGHKPEGKLMRATICSH